MNNTNTGGPAFPRPFSVDDADTDISYPAHIGMTLRDYFAAKAMQGFAAHPVGATKKYSETGPQANARLAYEYADAMLKAREQ